MKLWKITRGNGELGAVSLDKKLPNICNISSFSPAIVRKSLLDSGIKSFTMQLASGKNAAPQEGRQQIPDFLIWIWLPIFSLRASQMIIELGSTYQQLFPCRFKNNPEDEFFVHLPHDCLDIVDFEKSEFFHILTAPGKPSLPMFAKNLSIKSHQEIIPPCFRIWLPQFDRTLDELFVREDIVEKWRNSDFTGAEFFQVSS